MPWRAHRPDRLQEKPTRHSARPRRLAGWLPPAVVRSGSERHHQLCSLNQSRTLPCGLNDPELRYRTKRLIGCALHTFLNKMGQPTSADARTAPSQEEIPQEQETPFDAGHDKARHQQVTGWARHRTSLAWPEQHAPGVHATTTSSQPQTRSDYSGATSKRLRAALRPAHGGQ